MAEAITVHCPSCDTAFPVDPDKVPDGGVNARCSECSEVFRVDDPAAAGAEAGPGFGEPDAVEAEPTPGLEGAEDEPEEIGSEEGSPARSMGGAEVGAEETFDAPEGEAEPTEDVEGDPEAEDMDLETVDYFFGSDREAEGEPSGTEESGVGEDVGLDLDEPPTTEDTPTAHADPETAEPPTQAPDEEVTSTEPEALEEDLSPPEGSGTGATDTAAGPGRPTFGQRSPEEKAQRLARVLVSDMITYNPELYEKAVAQGTLKEDFEEEIEKSWEEYVEQVGEDLATSTPYWKDALNEILAEDEDVF